MGGRGLDSFSLEHLKLEGFCDKDQNRKQSIKMVQQVGHVDDHCPL